MTGAVRSWGRLTRLAGRFRRATREEKRAGVEAVSDLLAVALQLRTKGNRYASERAAGIRHRHPESGVSPVRLARIVGVVARSVPWSTNCLHRSLALTRTLRRRGLPAEVCFGVRRVENGLAFHAWVQVSGAVVNDMPNVADKYKILRGENPPGSAFAH